MGGSTLSIGRSRASLNKSQFLPMMMLDKKSDIEMTVLHKVRNVRLLICNFLTGMKFVDESLTLFKTLNSKWRRISL